MRCKTVDHRGGLDAFLMKAKDDELSPRVLELKRQIRKKAASSEVVSSEVASSEVERRNDPSLLFAHPHSPLPILTAPPA